MRKMLLVFSLLFLSACIIKIRNRPNKVEVKECLSFCEVNGGIEMVQPKPRSTYFCNCLNGASFPSELDNGEEE